MNSQKVYVVMDRAETVILSDINWSGAGFIPFDKETIHTEIYNASLVENPYHKTESSTFITVFKSKESVNSKIERLKKSGMLLVVNEGRKDFNTIDFKLVEIEFIISVIETEVE